MEKVCVCVKCKKKKKGRKLGHNCEGGESLYTCIIYR